jgi:hypothetical protein
MSKVSYSSAIGSLMYAMVCSRPNFSHAMSVVSRYMTNPSREHWKIVQLIFIYMCGSSNACLYFGKSRDDLFGYVDSNYAGDLDRKRSLSEYVFTNGGCTGKHAAISKARPNSNNLMHDQNVPDSETNASALSNKMF